MNKFLSYVLIMVGLALGSFFCFYVLIPMYNSHCEAQRSTETVENVYTFSM